MARSAWATADAGVTERGYGVSRCPKCGARGVRIADRRILDGVPLVFDYCGRCGKNWPPTDFAPPDFDQDGAVTAKVLKMERDEW